MVTWSLYRTANSGKYILHREECELQNSSGEENVQIDVCEDAKGILLLLARNKEALPFTSNELLIQAGASDPDFASYVATVVEDIN